MEESVPVIAGRREGTRGGGINGASRPPIRTPERWEYEILRLIAEQQAIPFDQLARFLDCGPEQASRVAKHLTKAAYTDYGRELTYEPHWIWLTRRGARFSGEGFEALPPPVGSMARIRAVNEVRLHIKRRAPWARWICERSVIREQGIRGHRPNAIVEIGEERHAIVARYGGPTEKEREIRVLETHMLRYDAVIAFAGRRCRGLLERLKREHHWPKLVIRPIPKPR
jgi:hypothetical protein